MAGHGCIGCYEPGFWDTMAPLQKPIVEQGIWDSAHTVDTIGLVLAGVTAAGIAAHAGLRSLRHRDKKEPPPDKTPDTGKDEAADTGRNTMNKKIIVDPITRIEGHLRIEVQVDETNTIRDAWSSVTLWRGLEIILKGRDPRDAGSLCAEVLRRMHDGALRGRHSCLRGRFRGQAAV